MINEFIKTLTFDAIVNLTFNAKNVVIYSSNNIDEETATNLLEISKKGIQVNIIIDPKEDNYRNGFGEIKSFEILEAAHIKIYELPGNTISFLIVDDLGYVFFPQSKIFEKEPSGPNAIKLDDLTIKKIKAHYFPPKSFEEKQKMLDDILHLSDSSKKGISELMNEIEGGKSDISLKNIDHVKIKEVMNNLKINPPLHPDIKRKINTYTAKMQFVELQFIGSNLKNTKLSIPENALPIKNTELSKLLDTKMNLFDSDIINKDLEELNNIKEKVEKLRYKLIDGNKSEGILVPIQCRNKSILKIESKQKLLDELKIINEEIENYKKNTFEGIKKEIINKRKMLKKELIEFMENNYPDDEYGPSDQDSLFDVIEYDCDMVISQIKFPEARTLVGKLQLKYNFYDLTFEDFRDKKLIEEFKIKGLLKKEELDEIVSFQTTFAIIK